MNKASKDKFLDQLYSIYPRHIKEDEIGLVNVYELVCNYRTSQILNGISESKFEKVMELIDLFLQDVLTVTLGNFAKKFFIPVGRPKRLTSTQ